MKYLLLLLLTGCVFTPEQRAAESGFIALRAVDTAQTLWIVRHPSICQTDPYNLSQTDCVHHQEGACPLGSACLIGAHPSTDDVLAEAAGEIGAHLALSYLFAGHPWLERIWQYGTIGLDLSAVSSNFQAGVKVSF